MQTTSPESARLGAAGLQADLTDLLQLEFDALASYAVAIAGLRRADLRGQLQAFRREHERHVRYLSAALRDFGGFPLTMPHMPTGLLKLGVQLSGLPGGERSVLLAFVANEWQSREKYARYAARPYPPELAALIQQHAADEAGHYAWACDALEDMGCGADTPIGRGVHAFARFHGSTAEAIESFGRGTMEMALRSVRPA